MTEAILFKSASFLIAIVQASTVVVTIISFDPFLKYACKVLSPNASTHFVLRVNLPSLKDTPLIALPSIVTSAKVAPASLFAHAPKSTWNFFELNNSTAVTVLIVILSDFNTVVLIVIFFDASNADCIVIFNFVPDGTFCGITRYPFLTLMLYALIVEFLITLSQMVMPSNFTEEPVPTYLGSVTFGTPVARFPKFFGYGMPFVIVQKLSSHAVTSFPASRNSP